MGPRALQCRQGLINRSRLAQAAPLLPLMCGVLTLALAPPRRPPPPPPAGTGKAHGDRHPKISDNVLIGASASVLGNIRVGKGAQVRSDALLYAVCCGARRGAARLPASSLLRPASSPLLQAPLSISGCRVLCAALRLRLQVAAGSLVLKDVPPRTLVAGSPAREIGAVTGAPAAALVPLGGCGARVLFPLMLLPPPQRLLLELMPPVLLLCRCFLCCRCRQPGAEHGAVECDQRGAQVEPREGPVCYQQRRRRRWWRVE